MNYNLASIDQEEKNKMKVDLIAAGIAFKERYNIPVIIEVVLNEQPSSLQNWFRERLIHYRKISLNLPKLQYKNKIKSK